MARTTSRIKLVVSSCVRSAKVLLFDADRDGAARLRRRLLPDAAAAAAADGEDDDDADDT
jgi:hypothetical protein